MCSCICVCASPASLNFGLFCIHFCTVIFQGAPTPPWWWFTPIQIFFGFFPCFDSILQLRIEFISTRMWKLGPEKGTLHFTLQTLVHIPFLLHTHSTLCFSTLVSLFWNSLYPLLLLVASSLRPVEYSRSFHGVLWWSTLFSLHQILSLCLPKFSILTSLVHFSFRSWPTFVLSTSSKFLSRSYVRVSLLSVKCEVYIFIIFGYIFE